MLRRILFFVLMVISTALRAGDYENVTIDPVDGSTVKQLYYFTLTFTDKNNVAPTWNVSAELYNAKTNKFVNKLDCSFAVGHKGVSLNLPKAYDVNGDYKLVIPAGLADLGDGTTNKAMTFSYTIAGGSGGDDTGDPDGSNVKLTAIPANGSTVTSLSHIEITFPDCQSASYEFDAVPYVLDDEGQKVADAEFSYGTDFNQLDITCTPITKAGTYTVVLPAGSVSLDGEDTKQNILLTYIIESKGFERLTLVEHFTSLFCVNCPAGDAKLEKLYENLGSKMAWVTHRVGYKNDEFTLTQDNDLLSFGVIGNPEVMFDRTSIDNGQPVMAIGGEDGYETVEEVFRTINAVPAMMGLEAKAVYDNNRLKVDIKGSRLAEAAGDDYSLHLYVMEDQVTSKAPQTGSNPVRYVHDNILRLIATPSAGAPITWQDNKFTYTDTLKIQPEWKREDMRLIAFVTRTKAYISGAPTGEVMNTTMTKVLKSTIDGSDDDTDPADRVRPDVTELSGAADATGLLQAQLTVTAPTTYRSGDPLEGKVDVIVLRDGATLKTFSLKAGETVVFDDAPTTDGLYNYQAVARQIDQVSDTVSLALFVGHDVPDAPHPIKLVKERGVCHLSWDVPGGGHGGYVDVASMLYSVVRVRQLPGDLKLVTKELAKGLTEPAFEDIPEEMDQGVYYYYRIYAYNADGQCQGYGRSDGVVLAKTAQLPYAESFANGKISTFWVEEHDNSSRFWPMEVADKYTQDNDRGLLGFTPYNANEWSRYLSGPISLKNAANPTLLFHLFYVEPQGDYFAVGISVNGGEWQPLISTELTDPDLAKQWIPVEIPLKDYADADYIQFCFEACSVTTITVLYIDNISLTDYVKHDVALTALAGPRKFKEGREDQCSVTLINKGSEAVTTGYTVRISANGESDVAVIDGPQLAVGEAITVPFALKAEKFFGEAVTLRAQVCYALDEAAYDDTLSIVVPVTQLHYPEPQNVVWTDGLLSWEAPHAPRAADEYVTDDFEEAPDFAITDFGDWTLLDKDNSGTYSIVPYPNAGQPCAYVVMNTAKVDKLDETGFDWSPHSGDKMLLAFAAPLAGSDNWLISPELSGNAQTLEFYARSIDPDYPETYKILWSDHINGSYMQLLSGSVGAKWEKISAQLPAGSRHFAIVNDTPEGRAFALDDITFVPDTLAQQCIELLGYNVYADGQCLTPQTPTTAMQWSTGGIHLAVSAVYDKGESNPVCVTTAEGLHTLEVLHPDAPVYTLQGLRLDSSNLLPHGVYIRAGKKIIK